MPDITLRPNVPVVMANEMDHRRRIAERANIGLPEDGSRPMVGPLPYKSYTAAGLPDASIWSGAAVYVSDAASLAYSNGVSWLYTAGVPSATVSDADELRRYALVIA